MMPRGRSKWILAVVEFVKIALNSVKERMMIMKKFDEHSLKTQILNNDSTKCEKNNLLFKITKSPCITTSR